VTWVWDFTNGIWLTMSRTAHQQPRLQRN
jgi:hypothetical protein